MFPSLFVFVCLLALNIFEVAKKRLGLLKYARLTSPLLTQSRKEAVLLALASWCLGLGCCPGTGTFLLRGLLNPSTKDCSG